MFENISAQIKPQRILTIDIETSLALVRSFQLFDVSISPAAVADPTRVLLFSAKWYGDPKSKIMSFSETNEGGRPEMVRRAMELFNEADVVVGWNVTFDIKHLAREAVQLGMPAYTNFKIVDAMRIVKKEFRFMSNSLAFVSTQLLGGDTKVPHTGLKLWLDCESDDPKVRERAFRLMARYCRGDVLLTERIYDLLRNSGWIRQHPHAGIHSDAPDACPTCGAGRKGRTYEGLRRTAAQAYDQWRCGKCQSLMRSNSPQLTPRLTRQAA